MQKVVVGLFLDVEQGKILLAKRHPFSQLAGYWEFPGGMQETGESEQGCLERQMFQGFNVNCQAFDAFHEVMSRDESKPITFVALLAKLMDTDLQPQLHEEVKWVDMDDLLDYQLVPDEREIAEKLIAAIQ